MVRWIGWYGIEVSFCFSSWVKVGWEFEFDNRLFIVGSEEIKMEEVKVGLIYGIFLLRRKSVYVNIIKEIRLCYLRLK